MNRFNILTMYRELEVERDKARVWAARWKRAAKAQRERIGLNDDRAELEQELRLNASMLARQCDLAREAETERDEAIREKHRAWASLDHAIEENRNVERERDQLQAERDKLRQEIEACQATTAAMRQALGKAHHELTILHGCYANDAPYAEGPDMASAWQIDTGVITNVIDRVLATTAGTKLLSELEALREVAEAARSLVKNLPPGEIEMAREAWGNTNTRIISESRMALAEALDELQ